MTWIGVVLTCYPHYYHPCPLKMFECLFLKGTFAAKVIFVLENTQGSFHLLLWMYRYQQSVSQRFCPFNVASIITQAKPKCLEGRPTRVVIPVCLVPPFCIPACSIQFCCISQAEGSSRNLSLVTVTFNKYSLNV